MIISDNFKKFLENTYKFNNVNNILITDLENVIYKPNNNFQLLCEPLDTNLKDIINSFNNPFDDTMICNSNNIVPVFANDKFQFNDYKGQLILPIYYNETLYGSLICMRYNRTFSPKVIEFFKTTQYFLNTFVEKSLKTNFDINKSYDDLKSIFSDIHLDFISELTEQKSIKLLDIKQYKESQKELYSSITNLKNRLSNNSEELQLLEKIEYLFAIEENYTNLLSYYLGMKHKKIKDEF